MGDGRKLRVRMEKLTMLNGTCVVKPMSEDNSGRNEVVVWIWVTDFTHLLACSNRMATPLLLLDACCIKLNIGNGENQTKKYFCQKRIKSYVFPSNGYLSGIAVTFRTLDSHRKKQEYLHRDYSPHHNNC